MPRDYALNKKPYWRDSKFWICPNHIPSARLPAAVMHCWFSNCNSVRPDRAAESSLSLIVCEPVVKCAWAKCNKNNGKPADRRERSKYCSLDCKNRNARWRYNLKKKKAFTNRKKT